MNRNIPNTLTWVRIAIVPLFVLLYYLPWSWGHFFAALLFSIAAITDWLDGYIARHWQLSSRFGAFLDPVADKLMVAVALVLVVGEVPMPFLTIPAAIIVGREIIVSALREWMAEIGKRTSVAVSIIGKIKTTCQMIALIALLLYRPESPFILAVLGTVMLYVAGALTIYSMIIYIKSSWRDLTLAPEK
ncbi:MAG: CDP-diacylglycerol--glycerol-3-phosphate 3-phosphatidyltransferase [Gammaproteobacteria bacterium]|nr:CDP-diacylglycerol--glycerol-3-phosphate 3-phosphatidyltransferase [Gammaproteobacteria bacterium]